MGHGVQPFQVPCDKSDMLLGTPPDTVYTAWTGPGGGQQRQVNVLGVETTVI